MSGKSIDAARVCLCLLAGLLLSGGESSELPPDFKPARELLEAGHYPEAQAAARAALARLKSQGRGESMEATHFLNLLAEALRLGGEARSPEASAAAERSLAIRERDLGPDHPEVAISLQYVAGILQETGQYAEARGVLQRALAIEEKSLGPHSLATGRVLHSLANSFQDEGDLETARRHYERALAIFEDLPERPKPELARTLNNLGNVLADSSDPEGAAALHERALAIRTELHGPRHPDVATSLNNLATIFDEMGHTTRARELYERALDIREEVLGPVHPWVASTLNNLGVLLASVGDYDAARPLHERALAIREKAFGPDHPLVAEVLANLAGLRWKRGDRKGARELYERAVSIFEKAAGPEHPSVAECLEGLAFLAEEEGDLERSRTLHERGLAIRRKVFGGDHFQMADNLEGLASLSLRAGNLAEARGFTEQALALRRGVLGEEHPIVAQSLRDLASLQWGSGEAAAGFDGALEAERIAREQFRAATTGLAEREALLYEAIRTSGLDLAASLLISAPPSSLPAGSAGRFADEVIRSRALVLDEMAGRRRALAGGVRGESARLAQTLTTARERLAGLVLRGPDPSRPDAYVRKVRNASAAKEKAERELAAASLRFRDERDRARVGLAEIRAALPHGATLVSYLQYGRTAPPSGKPESPGPRSPAVPSYLALILRQGKEAPAIVPLGTAERIDGLVRAWKTEAASDPSGHPIPSARESKYRESGARLRQAIWDPVASRLDGVQTVFLVPDGALNLVSFSALPASGDAYLIETGPTMHYLSAERDLKAPARPPGNRGGLLLVGGPDFDATPVPSAGPAAGPLPVGTRAGSPPARPRLRSSVSTCSDLRSLRFDPLPGARAETEELESLWTDGAGGGAGIERAASRLTGSQADEGSFKRMAPRHRILHLATHGFFLQGRCGSSLDEARSGARKGGARMSSALPSGESPLLLSGLAFAGANRRAESPPGGSSEDGILTAEEVASLDLTGVVWVVLSACDTGAGEVRSGEGVLGLRRAFETAGAGTLILSLWPVEDRAAADWMKRLYAARLRGLSTAESVRRAALETLLSRRERGRSAHPFYWGAFVAAGDWR